MDPASAIVALELLNSPFHGVASTLGSPSSTLAAQSATGTLADQRAARDAHLERHGTSSHTGYPFMQLARETGADYGDVLLYAEWQNNGGMWGETGPVGTPQQVRALQNTPYERSLRIDALMRLPVHLRGGNHSP